MPVRLLTSFVLKWPDAREVDLAVRGWVKRTVVPDPNVVRVGYFGSYARGDWGPGSDLDIIMIVRRSEEPFERRPARWDLTELPVPADLLVYTADEWEALSQRRVYRQITQEAIWVYPS